MDVNCTFNGPNKADIEMQLVKQDVDSLNELEFWSIVFKYFDDKTVWSAITKTRRYTREVTVINNYSIEISQDEIDAAIALSREKFLRDTWSEKKLAEEKAFANGHAEGREEQRLEDQVIIERLQAEIEALKKARA